MIELWQGFSLQPLLQDDPDPVELFKSNILKQLHAFNSSKTNPVSLFLLHLHSWLCVDASLQDVLC